MEVKRDFFIPHESSERLLFCHLTGLGRFDEAESWYSSQIGANRSSRTLFYVRSARYVTRTLGDGALWHPPGKQPAGAAFLGMVEEDEQYRFLSAKAQRIAEGFHVSWSPDGKKLAFSQGVLGFSGVAVYDMATGQTKLLITPGKDPMYSPDGKTIAYVRNRQILPLAHFSEDREDKHVPFTQEEIWVMNADGTAPRRLAQGAYPSWGGDSRRVFYHSRLDGSLYSVSMDDPTDQKRLRRCRGLYPVVSPDGKYVADPYRGILEIVELSTGSTVTRWDVPAAVPAASGVLLVSWSPEGRRLCVGAFGRRLGLWEFNLETGEAKKILAGYIGSAKWSPDGQHLAIASIGARGIWIAQAPDIGEGQTLEDHYREV
ncbi:MAG: PD40 domain-containing protein, partial [Planctomycetes bacterium]|nr:PD40 domain-containing protein [Planctomycetota bacterium]